MKRRSFLAMLSFAPVAGVMAAKGLPLLPEVAEAGRAVFRLETKAASKGYAMMAVEAYDRNAGAYRSAAFFLDVPDDPTGPMRDVFLEDV